MNTGKSFSRSRGIEIEELEEIGIAKVFPVESSLDSITEYFTGRGWEAGKNENTKMRNAGCFFVFHFKI